jgi:bifunctional DNA-binding transcriptional regulator/antitoxin component of YhaV-PrlF toxin-antitoxin module
VKTVSVPRGGAITLPADVLKQLGVAEGQHVYLVPDGDQYRLVGPQGYMDLLGEGEDGSG